MNDWTDTSGKATCFARDFPDGLCGIAYWNGIDSQWAWLIERLMKNNSHLVKFTAKSESAESAMREVDEWVSGMAHNLPPAEAMPLFAQPQEAPDA